MKGEIDEYPYQGVITRTIEGVGREKDTTLVIYEGVMDEHMTTPQEGRVMQTSEYIVSIPLTKDKNGAWIVPRKGDRISLMRFGERFELEVNNVDPSQLGGVSIYASRKGW